MTLIVAKHTPEWPVIGCDGITNAEWFITRQSDKLTYGKNFIVAITWDTAIAMLIKQNIDSYPEITSSKDVADFRLRVIELCDKYKIAKLTNPDAYNVRWIIITDKDMFSFDYYWVALQHHDCVAVWTLEITSQILMRSWYSVRQTLDIISENDLTIRPPFYFWKVTLWTTDSSQEI
jgi:hypothetical protein